MPKKSKAAVQSGAESGHHPSERPHPSQGSATDGKKKGNSRKGRRGPDSSDSEDEDRGGSAQQHDSANKGGNGNGSKRQDTHQMKCFFCGRRGHTRGECPEAQGGRSSAKQKGRKERGQKNRKDSIDEGAADAPSPLPACEFPFVDACCCLHGCFGRANYYGPASAFLEARGLQGSCEGVVAVFADAACMAQSSDRYRCWEEILSADRIVGAFGCWPSHAQELEAAVEGRLEQWIEACGPKVVALVGGLDYSPHAGGGRQGHVGGEEDEEEARAAQRRVLGRILSLSQRMALPVVLSCLGGAEKDLSALLSASALPPESSRILLADFSGDLDFLVLKLLRQWPHMSVGFDGRLTFSKAEHLRGLLFDVPLERLLLQSSAPNHLPAALSPSSHHHEGFSHPAVVPAVAAKVAELKEATLEEVMEQARSNAKAMFGI